MDPNAIVEIFRRNVTEHYIDFQGRVRRHEFWHYVLALVVIYVIAGILQSVIGSHLLTSLLSLGLFLPNLGMAVRRLHDTGRSGWWVLIGVIPFAAMIVLTAMAIMTGSLGTMFLTTMLLPILMLAAAALLIYWYAQPGVVGPNEYGPDPKGAPVAA